MSTRGVVETPHFLLYNINMKVIFLDCDGVLNSDFSERKNGPRICGYTGIESSLVKKLRSIVEVTSAKIILVSSWKESYEWYKASKTDILVSDYDLTSAAVGKYLCNKLNKEHLYIIDTTYRFEKTSYDRGTAIRKYIDYYNSISNDKVENFVILDDEIFDDYYLENNLIDNLVKTNPHVGLADRDVEKAIKILKGE